MNKTNLCILHTNDTHSYLEEFGKRAALVQEIKQKNTSKNIHTLLVDSGDVFSGTMYFTMYQGKKEAELMNMLGYDAMTFGNHGFDLGPKALADFLKIIHFPMISSNVICTQDTDLKDYVGTKIVPYQMLDLENGERIGLFGMTTPSTVESASPSEDIIFADPKQTAETMVNMFHAHGINKIILLSHLGDDEDAVLAEQVSGISLIVGAHTHRVLQEPLKIRHQETQFETVIVQAGSYGEYLGQVDLTFDTVSGELQQVKACLHDIAAYPQVDSAVQEVIETIKCERHQLATQKIVDNAKKIDGNRLALRKSETVLGNIIADAYFYHAQKQGFSPDFAVVNSGGIRNSLPAGEVTFGDIVKILPFSKTLKVLSITGKMLMDALQKGLYPQVSQLQVTYDYEKPKGQQLVESKLVKSDRLLAIDENKNYILATNSFVGIGKDGYKAFKQAEVLFAGEELDVHILTDYLQHMPQPVRFPEEQRIMIKNVAQVSEK
ncbi:bifunctional metallophosphatase/5'-nucleotidase [Enterococcus saccharolyticus]|uniref:bifunctional metallophosphatase/5'-nucleotidase n=1 Tax=Enterococcus saccharolyticus TaxID=41997 RepID=UPI0039DFB149